ncbi:hypothetical protein A6I85_05800 [Prescottella equi]|nr:hypothetical protein A6I85_05800 [Prescottella equi]
MATRLGWEIVEVFSDNDVSAYSSKPRPAYRRMLEAIEQGRVDAVIAWHTDRLHRRPSELEEFITLVEQHGVAIQTVKSGNLDLSTSAGKMVARLLGAVARAEVDSARDRMVRAHEQAAANGQWRARRRVFGWVKGGSEVVPAEATAIQAAAKAILSGTSLRAVARQWNEAGLETTGSAAKFDASAVRDILASPRCASIQVYKGREVGKGNWPSILTEDEHRALVALFANPARRRSVSYERRYPGSGIYRCGVCGAPMESHSDAKGERSYRCTESTSHVSRRSTTLDEHIAEQVLKRLARRNAHLLLERREDGVDLGALQVERDGLSERLSQLAGLFAAGDIDAAQLRDGTAALRTKIEAIDAKLAAAQTSSPLAGLVMASQSGFLVEQLWNDLSPDVRGKVIAELADVTILRAPRGQRKFQPEFVKIDWRKPLELTPEEAAPIVKLVQAGR